MRGKPHDTHREIYQRRLIPAHAGKTSFSFLISRAEEAHPRACGENCLRSVACLSVRGSSPRMRGKPERALLFNRLGRLIPAHAGKTVTASRYRPPQRAHPRACGENVALGTCQGNFRGSSPRMRGKPTVQKSHNTRSGLIPAHAGKTCQQGCQQG